MAIACLMLTGCGDWQRVGTLAFPASHDPASAATVDPRTCAACHADIVEEWEQSHHAHANRLIDMAVDRAAFQPQRQLMEGEGHWVFLLQGGRPSLSYQYGQESAESYRPVGVIAVKPLWQYLIPFPGGRFQVTSAAYDPQAGDWFGVFGGDIRQPGEWGHWSEQGMNWNANCAYCHMTAFHKNLTPDATGYASTWQAQGIRCAQCHTDLAAHVASARRGGSVLPATLSAAQWQASCASCHARREELTPNTFRPGDRFDDHFRVSLPDMPGVYHPDGQVADEDFVYGSMLLNRMGHAGITCLDCHNPHLAGLKLPVENNALCMTCHATGDRGAIRIDPVAHSHHAADSPGNRCVECHMPVNRFMVRDARRDHIFLRPDPFLTEAIGVSNTCNSCHEDQSVDWAIDWAQKWYGDRLGGRPRERALVIDAYERGELEGYAPLLNLARTEELVGWRAAMVAMLRPWVRWAEVRQFLVRELRHPEALVRAAAVRALSDLPEPERLPLFVPLLRDSVRLVRLEAAMVLPPAAVPDNVREEMNNYLHMNADRPAGALRLAQRELARGERQAVASWVRLAIGLDPASTPIVRDGAVLLAQAGQADESLAVLREALERHPGDAELLYSQGLLLAERGDYEAAARSLEQSVAAQPSNHRTWLNLALIYDRQNRLADALAAIEKALAHDPSNPTYLQAKASFLLKLGRSAEARDVIDSLRRGAIPQALGMP